MAFSRTFLSLVAAIAISGSLARGGSTASSGRGPRYEPTRPGQFISKSSMKERYTDSTHYGRPQYKQGDRYEPTRPWQLADNDTTVARHIDGARYDPTRHRQTDRRQRPRYEPTRPNRLPDQSHPPRRSRNDQWEATYNRYGQLTSAQNNYERWDSRYRDYQEGKKWHQKVAKGGKTLFKPVKFAFKLSKKAVSKATFGWLPLL